MLKKNLQECTILCALQPTFASNMHNRTNNVLTINSLPAEIVPIRITGAHAQAVKQCSVWWAWLGRAGPTRSGPAARSSASQWARWGRQGGGNDGDATATACPPPPSPPSRPRRPPRTDSGGGSAPVAGGISVSEAVAMEGRQRCEERFRRHRRHHPT
jgi:hypothetical protein